MKKKNNEIKDWPWESYSRSEVLQFFIEKLRQQGMDSQCIGEALADIWMALPEDLK